MNIFTENFRGSTFMEDNRGLPKYSFVDGEVTSIYAAPFFNIEKLFKRDFSFVIEGFNGSKLIKRSVNRSDFHPLLFAESMNEYMRDFLKAVQNDPQLETRIYSTSSAGISVSYVK